MKTSRLFVLALAVVAAASCAKETVPVLKSISFTASIDDLSKTTIDESMKVKFSANDSIAVFADGVMYKLGTEEGGYAATFTGEVPEASVYYAVYPANAAVGASIVDGKISGVVLNQGSSWVSPGQFAPSKAISVAKAEGGRNLKFKNVCALLKITVPEDVTDLKEMIFFARNGEAFAGTMTITPGDSPSFAVTEKKSQIGAAYLENGSFAPGTYYVPILPCTMAKGFDVKLMYAGGAVTRGISTKALTLERNKVYDLGTIRKDPTYLYEGFESYVAVAKDVPFTKDAASGEEFSGNTNALIVKDNPKKTTYNNSDIVLCDDMSATSGATSGLVNVNFSSTKFPTYMRGWFTKVGFKVYMGSNKYYPRIFFAKDSAKSRVPARVNGVSITSQADWDAAFRADDWNTLEWDATQINGWTTVSNFAAFQIRAFVDFSGTNLGKGENSDHVIYFDDIYFGI